MKRIATTLILLIIIILLVIHASWVIISKTHTHIIAFNPAVYVTGEVVGLPEYQPHRERFMLKWRHKYLIQLVWYGHYPWVKPGEVWQLKIKSSRHLLENTPTFNYANWLKWHGFISAAYVVNKGINKRIKPHQRYAQPINTLRYGLRWQLFKVMRHLSFHDILIALSMGDRSYLTPQHWQVFTHTGTSHLIAISGLHVSLLAGVMFFILRWVCSCFIWITRRVPAQHIAMIGAMISACGYSILSGFAVTTMRAFVMILIVAIATLWRRKLVLLSGWLVALLCVVLLEPGQFSSAGTWLSFGAVAWLYYTLAGRVGKIPRHFVWWYPQWPLFIGLAPLVIYWFQAWSMVSFMANIIAIPVVSFIVLPLALLGTVLVYPATTVAHGIFWLANEVLSWLWWWLHWLASRAWWGVQFNTTISVWQCIVATIGAAWLLAPRAIPARWVGWILFCSLFVHFF